MIYTSIVVTSTNPCFNRGASGACVLVSIRGRCCFKTLVRPINGAAHRALSAGLVIRAVSPRTNRRQICWHDSLFPIHFSTTKRDLFFSFANTIKSTFTTPRYVDGRVDSHPCADATRWLARSGLPSRLTHERNPYVFIGPYSICLTETTRLFGISAI